MQPESPISYSQSLTSPVAPKKPKKRFIRRILFTVAVVLIVLACLVVAFVFFYLIPLRPVITLVGTETKNVALVPGVSKPFPVQWLSQTLKARLLLRVRFQNRYHFALTLLNILLNVQVGKGASIGKGSLDSVRAEKKSATEFTLPLDLGVPLNSSAGREIVVQCTARRVLNLSIPIQCTLSLFNLKIPIKFTKTHRIDCKSLLGNFVQ